MSEPSSTCECGGHIGWQRVDGGWEGSCYGACGGNPIIRDADELDRIIDELMEHAHQAMGPVVSNSVKRTPDIDDLVRRDLRKYLEGRVHLEGLN